MTQNDILVAIHDASATATALRDTADGILDKIENCSKETTGEILGLATALVGLAHQLLIDINSLAKAE